MKQTLNTLVLILVLFLGVLFLNLFSGCEKESIADEETCDQVVLDKDVVVNALCGSPCYKPALFYVNGQEVTEAQFRAADYGDCFYW